LNYGNDDPGSGLPWAQAAQGSGPNPMPPALMQILHALLQSRMSGGHTFPMPHAPQSSGGVIPPMPHEGLHGAPVQNTASVMPPHPGMGLVPLPNPRPEPSDVVGRAVATGRPNASRAAALQRLLAAVHGAAGHAGAAPRLPWMLS
jgi:hypothetical protein